MLKKGLSLKKVNLNTMRWALGGMKAVIAVAYLLAISLLILAAAPLATGGLEVRVPEDVGKSWHLQGNDLYNQVELSIFNSGMLDIQGMTVRVELRDVNETLITTSVSPATQLNAGQWSKLGVNVSVNTLLLSRDQLRDLVFNTSNIHMNLKVDAGMALGLMALSLDRTGLDNLTKSAMISDIRVGEEIALRNVSGGVQASIPFSLSASEFLEGTSIHVECIMRNTSVAFATTNADYVLHPSTQATLEFLMNPAHYQAFLANSEDVRLEMTITYLQAELPLTFSIPFHNSIYGVAVQELQAFEDTATHYALAITHWQTMPSYLGQVANVTCEIRNATALIGRAALDQTLSAYNSAYFYCTMSQTDWDWFLHHGDDWTVTMTFMVGPYLQTNRIAAHWTPPFP